MGLTARNVGTNASANRIHLFVMTRVSARTFKTYRGTFQSLEANHRQPKDGFLLKPRQSSTHCALDAVAVMSRSKYKGALQCRGKPPMVLRPTSALNRELITADFNDDRKTTCLVQESFLDKTETEEPRPNQHLRHQ